MNQNRYIKPFMMACVLNMVFILLLFGFGEVFFRDPQMPKKETVIALDMSKYEVQDKKKAAAGGISQKVQAGSSSFADQIKQSIFGDKEEDNRNISPNNERTTSPTKMDKGAPNGDPNGPPIADSSPSPGPTPGPNGPVDKGPPGGNPTDERNADPGYVDKEGFQSRLESMKTYPEQAKARKLEGTAVFRVDFSKDGQILSITLVSSSGHAILDKAARRLIENGGSVTNTTGKPGVFDIPITYEY